MTATDATTPPTLSPGKKFLRGGLALLVVGFLAWGSWRSVPRERPQAPPRDLAFARRFVLATHSTIAPRHAIAGVELTTDAYRVPPGRAFQLECADLDGVLAARFQAVSPKGAVIEVIAEGAGLHSVILRRELSHAQRQSDDQPFFLMIDSRVLPPGTQRIALHTSPASPGAVDWRELDPMSESDYRLPRSLPFPFVAFSGFQPPDPHGDDVNIHAPGAFILLAPAGRHTVDFVFGYNPAVFAQPANYTDGAIFAVTLDGASSALFERHLTPMTRPDDRLDQHAVITLDLARPTLLRFATDPGPDGNISFDWLRWGRFQSHRAAATP